MVKNNCSVIFPRPLRNILIIRLSALGDVAMTIPVVYSLCEAYPDVNFTMLTTPVISRIFINRPDNLKIYPAEIRGRHRGIKGIYVLYKELRALSFDGIADLHNVLRSRLLCALLRLSGVKSIHINKGRIAKCEITARRHKKLRQLPTSFHRYTDVFRKLGFSFPENFVSIYGKQKAALPEILLSEFSSEEHCIGVAPFAKHQGKIYPEKKMEQLIPMLAKTGEYKIFLFGGGEKESLVLNRWASDFPDKVVSLTDMKLGFSGELALMSHLKLLVSMDSANMHLASLVGLPVISVWGATHPYAGFLGWRQSLDNVVQLDLPCRPCSIFGNRPCWRNDYACLNEISPEEIADKIKKEIYAQK